MKLITSTAKSGGNLDTLLRELPSGERARVERLFRQLGTWVQPTATATAVSAGPALAEGAQEAISREVNFFLRQQPNQNQLAR